MPNTIDYRPGDPLRIRWTVTDDQGAVVPVSSPRFHVYNGSGTPVVDTDSAGIVAKVTGGGSNQVLVDLDADEIANLKGGVVYTFELDADVEVDGYGTDTYTLDAARLNVLRPGTPDGGESPSAAPIEVPVTLKGYAPPPGVNRAPSWATIPDVTGNVGDGNVVYDLNAYASDPDNDTLTYTLVGSPASASLSGSTLTISRAAAVSETITVRADDGALTSDATFDVTVTVAANQAPTVSASASPASPLVGNAVSLTASASDSDGTIASYAWALSGPAGSSASLSGAASASASFTPDAPGTYTATVTVTDDDGAQATAAATVTATTAPVDTSPAIDSATPTGDPAVTLAVAWTGGDGPFDVAWTPGDGSDAVTQTGVSGTTASLAYTFPSNGTYGGSVTVTDSDGDADTATVNVEIAGVNAPPTVANPIADVTGTAGDADVTVDLDTVFSDSDALAYALVGSPASATISGSTLTISRDAAVSETVTVEATDTASQSVQDSFTVTVTSSASASLGTITQDPDPAAYDTVVELVSTGYSGVTLAVRTLEGDVIDTDADGNGRLTVPAEFTYQDIALEVYDASGATADTQQVALNLSITTVQGASGGSVGYTHDLSDVPVEGQTPPVGGASAGTVAYTHDLTDVPLDTPAQPVSGASAGSIVYAHDQADVPLDAANPPPTVSAPIADVTGTAGDADVTVDLDAVFSDSDALTYTIVGASASSSISGSTLTVSRASAVNETVTVRATDTATQSVDASFSVTVSATAVAGASGGSIAYTHDLSDVPVSAVVAGASAGAVAYAHDLSDVPVTV